MTTMTDSVYAPGMCRLHGDPEATCRRCHVERTTKVGRWFADVYREPQASEDSATVRERVTNLGEARAIAHLHVGHVEFAKRLADAYNATLDRADRADALFRSLGQILPYARLWAGVPVSAQVEYKWRYGSPRNGIDAECDTAVKLLARREPGTLGAERFERDAPIMGIGDVCLPEKPRADLKHPADHPDAKFERVVDDDHGDERWMCPHCAFSWVREGPDA